MAFVILRHLGKQIFHTQTNIGTCSRLLNKNGKPFSSRWYRNSMGNILNTQTPGASGASSGRPRASFMKDFPQTGQTRSFHLGSISLAELEVAETFIPEQKLVDGQPFPLVLENSARLATVSEAEEWVRTHKATIEDKLLQYGAIFFRGFPLQEPIDFDRFVKAFEYSHLPYIGGAAPRNVVVGDVYTTNESPPDQVITFHHEMAQVPLYPSKLFFFCDVVPAEGGQTPVAPSFQVYDMMAARHPEFVAKLESQGVIYTRVLPDGDDNFSPIGRGWQSTFLTQDKAAAERKCKEHGTTFEWLADGCFKTITAVMPGVKVDERTGKRVWFNSIINAYRAWRDVRNTPEKSITFADGTAMPADVMDSLDEVFKEVEVAVNWQHGDVMMVDNKQVLHARRPYTPPRRILACLIR